MLIVAFHDVFPEIAHQETRAVGTVERGGPVSWVHLHEFYCADPACDCRRVVLVAIAEDGKPVATISHSFEPPRGDEPQTFLDPLNPQSAGAHEFLQLAKRLVLTDRRYCARLRRHYRMVKEAASDPEHPLHRLNGFGPLLLPEPVRRSQPRIGRNDRCPCGSGRKWKKCCGALAAAQSP